MKKIIIEFLPLVAFLLGYKLGGIMLATLYMLICTIGVLLFAYATKFKIPKFALISHILLIISGGIALISGNEKFIKVKPTIVYLIFCGLFLLSTIKKKPMVKHMFEGYLHLKEEALQVLGYRFAMFFFAMAILNELIWRNFSDGFWVKFKIFGALPLTILFIALQIPYILKHRIDHIN